MSYRVVLTRSAIKELDGFPQKLTIKSFSTFADLKKIPEFSPPKN